MRSEPTQKSTYMSPTSPEWAAYYKKAKATRRLGKGQQLQKEAKRRRRRENIIALASTAVLVAVVAICAALLGSSAPSETPSQNERGGPSGPAGHPATPAAFGGPSPSLTADGRRG